MLTVSGGALSLSHCLSLFSHCRVQLLRPASRWAGVRQLCLLCSICQATVRHACFCCWGGWKWMRREWHVVKHCVSSFSFIYHQTLRTLRTSIVSVAKGLIIDYFSVSLTYNKCHVSLFHPNNMFIHWYRQLLQFICIQSHIPIHLLL